MLGSIDPPGSVEGGDLTWLDERTLAAGHGYRTNAEGLHQLHALLEDAIDELLIVPLPHWRGPDDVMHLMSLISPIDRDLALVYSPLLPVPFRTTLLDRGFALVEVAEDEFDRMGTNVLTIAPRTVIALKGNSRTRAALEQAGVQVLEYRGHRDQRQRCRWSHVPDPSSDANGRVSDTVILKPGRGQLCW